MEKNKLGFNLTEEPNQGDHFVTIGSCGTPNDWGENPFEDPELAQQTPAAPEAPQPLKDEAVDKKD